MCFLKTEFVLQMNFWTDAQLSQNIDTIFPSLAKKHSANMKKADGNVATPGVSRQFRIAVIICVQPSMRPQFTCDKMP